MKNVENVETEVSPPKYLCIYLLHLLHLLQRMPHCNEWSLVTAGLSDSVREGEAVHNLPEMRDHFAIHPSEQLQACST